jgi:7-carboxy-7-deazaguanine synthase
LISPLVSSQISHGSHTSTRGTIRIAETFTSRQGEGKLTGTDSYFIRTSGCNLRCWFCDTPYASWSPAGETLSIEAVAEQALESGRTHVVLTGGEPLLPRETAHLCNLLRAAGRHITIETAGTIDRIVECDLMSISPKFRSSAPDPAQHPRWNHLHQQRRMPISTIRSLIDHSNDFQLKFVVDSPHDYPELLEIADQIGAGAQDVWVMPQGSSVAAMDAAAGWLQPWCESQGFHYCDRMQIRWYGNRRGT